MEPKIVGTVMPVLELSMQPNEKVFAESGQLAWMSMAMQMQTSTSAGGQQGGFMGALGRAVAGGTLFMTEYTALGGPGLLAFAAKLPGQILPMEIAPGQGYMVHRHGFMCATIGVQFSIGFQQRLGAGVFGGTGFRMQRLQGQGQAWVELNGEVVTYDLQPGNTLRVHPGHVGMYQESVQFNITTVPGIQNAFFGGGGLFLASLTRSRSICPRRGEIRVTVHPSVRGGNGMAKYMIHGSYSVDGIKGVLKEGGSSRRAAVDAATKALGGKLEAFYFSFGKNDVVGIVDAPDNVTAAAFSMAIAATGTVRTETIVLLTPEEIDQAAKKTVAFRAAGQ